MKRQFILGSVFATSMAVGVGAQNATTPQQQGQTGTAQQQQQGQQVTLSGCLQRAEDVKDQKGPAELSGEAARSGQTREPGYGTGTETGAQRDAQRTEQGATASDVRFVLTQATTSGTASQTGTQAEGQTGSQPRQTGTEQEQVGTTGTAAGTSGTAAAGPVYRLTGGQHENLERHVNKRVEVRGTIEPRTGTEGHQQSGQAGHTGSRERAGTTGAAEPGTQAGAMAHEQGDLHHAPKLRVTSVREVAGSCDAQGR